MESIVVGVDTGEIQRDRGGSVEEREEGLEKSDYGGSGLPGLIND